MARREHDAYYTPGWMVRALLKYGPMYSSYGLETAVARQQGDQSASSTHVFEPCVGDGAIVRELVKAGFNHGHTNDIDPKIQADFHFDAAQPWPAELRNRFHWIPSNTPWAMPKKKPPLPVLILKNALENVRQGGAVSLLFRITFLEPCENRGAWLQDNPPDQVIVLPRYSFTQNGKSDSATAAWMTWFKGGAGGWSRKGIVIANDAESL